MSRKPRVVCSLKVVLYLHQMVLHRPVWPFASAARPCLAALESTSQKDPRIPDSCE